MTQEAATDVLRQHLIDPEICIRCNTCEETCPIDAITHDARNYVVDPAICNACNACIGPCPTGAIDNWRNVVRSEAYTLEAQLGWDTLPRRNRGGRGAGRRGIAGGGRRDHRPGDGRPGRAGIPAMVRCASLHQSLYADPSRHGHRVGQLSPDGGRRLQRRPPHRARLRRDHVPGARGPDHRHRAARPGRAGPSAPRPALFGGEPARRRAATLQQPVAHREARHRGPRRDAGAGRRVQLTCAISRRETRSSWSGRTAPASSCPITRARACS